VSRRKNRTIGTLAAVLIAATLAPSASLAADDLRSQDALDAARSLPPEQLVAVSEALHSRDLRAQDALDAARGLPPDQVPAVSEGLRAGAATTARLGTSDGFDWFSAVIGAAGAFALIGVSRAGARQIRRRPAQITHRAGRELELVDVRPEI
jgi:hypothetical protein